MPAMHTTPSEEEIVSTLSHLKLSTKVPQKPAQKPKSKPVADSWDDELSGSDTETDERKDGAELPSSKGSSSPRDSLNPLSTSTSLDRPPSPPPPTPASPTPFDLPSRGNSNASSSSARNLDKRPEKTTAVAGRLIAGALGVRAPKRTEEEREFDRAMKERERKRRDEEREREKREGVEREERKRAVWED